VTTPIVLPWPLQSSLEAATRAVLDPGDRSSVDFSRPTGEAALVSPASVSWRVFKNSLSLFIGGVTAVVMELAEPRVSAGVWDHTNFRGDPIRRLRRTGFAAMVTIYGARSTAEAMIARVRRMHDMVAGTTPSGEAYCANNLELLNWVQATAYFRRRLVDSSGRILCSRFLAIMRSTPILPLRPFQHLLVRAAIDLTPRWLRTILRLNKLGLRAWEAKAVRQAAAFVDRIVVETNPAVQACRRMRLPGDYLYSNE
jgi:uncharacterized protein (DUF2236 family)